MLFNRKGIEKTCRLSHTAKEANDGPPSEVQRNFILVGRLVSCYDHVANLGEGSEPFQLLAGHEIRGIPAVLDQGPLA